MICNKIFLSSLLTILTANAEKHCKGIVKFDNVLYEKEYLADGTVSKPFFMTYIEDGDQILFTEDTEPFGNTETFILDINTKELKQINADKAVVHDIHNNGTIFIGQDGGLFVLDKENNKLTVTDLKDVVFYSMLIHNDKIVYTDYPLRDVYVYENGVTNVFMSDLGINDVAFDKNDNIYYYNKTGIYVKFAHNSEIVNIDATEYEEVPLIGVIYEDSRDAVFATSVYGVFKVDLDNRILKRVSMKTMFDITFDKNGDLIYSDEESIVRLKATNKTC